MLLWLTGRMRKRKQYHTDCRLEKAWHLQILCAFTLKLSVWFGAVLIVESFTCLTACAVLRVAVL